MKKFLKILFFIVVLVILCSYNTSFSADETNTSQQGEGSSSTNTNTSQQGEGSSSTNTDEVVLTGISLNFKNITLSLKSTETWELVVFGTPSNATMPEIVWTSSDTNIVTVQPGETNVTASLTPVSVGTATITAKTIDGNFSATCTVKVISDIIETVDAGDVNTKPEPTINVETEKKVEDATAKTGILPKTGINFRNFIFLFSIVLVSFISYKRYKKYKGI